MLILLTLGIVSVSLFPFLLPLWLSFGLLALALCSLWLRRIRLCLLLIGLVYGNVYGYYLLDQQLPNALDGQVFLIQGALVDLPENDDERRRFYLRVEKVIRENDKKQSISNHHLIGKKVLISWYSNNTKNENLSPWLDLQAGERWQILVKLKRPRGFVNPFGFDYQQYLLKKRVAASGYVKPSQHNYRLDHHCQWINSDCWREGIRSAFSKHLDDHQNLGLLLALAIGDRHYITDEQWALLRDTGTIHLMAISGLHIGLAAGMGFILGRIVVLPIHYLQPLSLLPLYIPRLSSIIFALLYSALAGWSLPTQRALLMVVIFHVLRMFYQKPSAWFVLNATLAVVTVIDPLIIYDASAWLSFLAVLTLLYSFTGYRGRPKHTSRLLQYTRNTLIGSVKSQWVICIGLLLPSVVFIQGVSLSAPLANAVAIPVVSVVVVPALLFSSLSVYVIPHVAELSLALANNGLTLLVDFFSWLNTYLPGFWQFQQAEPTAIALVLAIVATACLLLPRGLVPAWLPLCCLLALFFPQSRHHHLTVTFLDVGQGTAVVIETPSRVLVYDVGRQYSPRFDVGEDIIAPYLIKRGYQQVDRVIVSHSDHDHSGGLDGLLSAVAAKSIITGEPNMIDAEPCKAGDEWQWDGITFSILWPDATMDHALDNNNNHSCVLLMTIGDSKIVLPGDIEKRVERLLLQQDRLNDIDILLAPHHGSRSSSHLAWVNTLRPKEVVFTVGYKNHYRHPHVSVQQRYQKIAANVYNTSESGAVQFIFDEKNHYEVVVWRDQYRRYWY